MSHATTDSRIQSYIVCRGLLRDCEILSKRVQGNNEGARLNLNNQ